MQQTNLEIKRYWEYQTRVYHISAFSGSKAIETTQDLNELGVARWEVYSVVANGDFLVYNLKRVMFRG